MEPANISSDHVKNYPKGKLFKKFTLLIPSLGKKNDKKKNK